MNTLIAILAKKSLVPASEIKSDTDLFRDLELDSLCLVDAFLEVEKQFRVKLQAATIAKSDYNTPEKFFALIQSRLTS